MLVTIYLISLNEFQAPLMSVELHFINVENQNLQESVITIFVGLFKWTQCSEQFDMIAEIGNTL